MKRFGFWTLAVGALAVVMVGLAVVLVVDELSASRRSRSTASVRPQGRTAKEAFTLASESARVWQEDAQLVGARATVQEAGAARSRLSGWTFQFFSGGTQRLALFTTSDGGVTRIRDRLSPYSVPTIAMDAWWVDSDTAIKIWEDNGGAYLLERRMDTEVSLRLYVAEGQRGRARWAISGSVPDAASAFTVEIDAVSGKIVDR